MLCRGLSTGTRCPERLSVLLLGDLLPAHKHGHPTWGGSAGVGLGQVGPEVLSILNHSAVLRFCYFLSNYWVAPALLITFRSLHVERLQLCPVCKDGRVDKRHDSTACTTIALKRFCPSAVCPTKVALLWKRQNSHQPPKFGSHSLTLSTCSQNLMPQSQCSRLENSKQVFEPNVLYWCASLLQVDEEEWYHKCVGESLHCQSSVHPKVQGCCCCDRFHT